MIKIGRAILIAVICLGIVSCEKSYDDERRDFVDSRRGQQIGSSPDYWLMKQTFGTNDRIAFVFGMVDDFAFCSELADLYMKRYPGETYICVAASEE